MKSLFRSPLTWINSDQSLRWRLLILLGGMLLVTLTVIGASVFFFISGNERSTWQERQIEAAHYAASTVSAFIQRTTDNLIVVSSLDRDVLENEPQILDEILDQSPAFLEIIRLDDKGQVFVSSYKDAPILANQFTIPQSVWFSEGKARRLYLSSVQISSSSQPYLIMSVPAFDGGVVAGRLRMNLLWDVVSDLHFGQTGQAYVVNQEGQIIGHSDPEVILSKISLNGRTELENSLQSPNEVWSGTYINFEGYEVIGVTVPVGNTKWLIFSELAVLEAYSISRTSLLLLGGGMAIFGLLVMVVTGRFLGRLILKPMDQLRSGAVRIGEGELDHQIDLQQQDEVGQVAKAFNEMARQLRDRERQIAERTHALEESEERFRRVISSISDHIYMTELAKGGEPINRYLSPNIEHLTGYPIEKFMLDWSFWSSVVIHPQDRRIAARQLAKFKQGESSEVEYRIIRADGQMIWVRDSGRVDKHPRKDRYIAYGVVSDITERKQAEKAMEQQRAFLQQVIDINPHFIFAKDRAGRFTLVNQAFATAYGGTIDELLGRTDADFNPNEELVKRYRADDLDVMNTQKELFIPEECIEKENKNFWRQTIKRPIVGADGEVNQVLGVATDITERKEAEQALALARDKALEASRFKTRLLANVSHDLRTPLGGILGYTEMLQAGVYGDLTEEQIEATNEIVESTNQLLSFVNNLLNQARVESGKVKINNAPFSPETLMKDVKSMFGPLAQTKGLALYSHLDPDIPDTLSGDVNWLRQMIGNLVGNSVKFTEEGEVRLQIYLTDEDHWAIEISDTGPGIPKEAQSYIFEAFRQVDGSLTREHGGSGLGLAIVKQLTVLMGGEITLSSELEKGSTFTIILPLVPIQEKSE